MGQQQRRYDRARPAAPRARGLRGARCPRREACRAHLRCGSCACARGGARCAHRGGTGGAECFAGAPRGRRGARWAGAIGRARMRAGRRLSGGTGSARSCGQGRTCWRLDRVGLRSLARCCDLTRRGAQRLLRLLARRFTQQHHRLLPLEEHDMPRCHRRLLRPILNDDIEDDKAPGAIPSSLSPA